MKERNICRDILFGVAVGDALGVPVEFKSRLTIAQNPVTDMIGFGTYNLAFRNSMILAFTGPAFSICGRCPASSTGRNSVLTALRSESE